MKVGGRKTKKMLVGAACDSRMTMIGEDGKDEDKEELGGGVKQRGRYGDPAAVNHCGKKGEGSEGGRRRGCESLGPYVSVCK